MQSDFDAQLSTLQNGDLNDHEAELLLKAWNGTLGHAEMLEACLSVLTARANPPRMGSTIAAAQSLARDASTLSLAWERLMSMAPMLDSIQITNWIYGHNYRRYDRETFERFQRLSALVCFEDRLGIAIMLSTWCGYDADAEEVIRFIDRGGGK